MTPYIVLGCIVILVLGTWAIFEYDPRDKRRLKRYIALHANEEKLFDDVEKYIAERISKVFLVGLVNADELRPSMKIRNLYKIDNKRAVLDDMEYEQLIMDVEERYSIKIAEDDIVDFGTIREFSNFVKSRNNSSG